METEILVETDWLTLDWDPIVSIYNVMELKMIRPIWGSWVESAIGALLLNFSWSLNFNVRYWWKDNDEVDFVMGKIKLLSD